MSGTVKKFGWVLLLPSLLALVGCGGGGGKLRGAGSSFVKPVMDKWVAEYGQAKGVSINYQATGSGNGIESTIDHSVDFGATDAFMKDEQLTKAKEASNGGEVVHIPLVMGGIVPAYNLEKLEKPLQLTGEVLADVYRGKITRWNDERIKELNKDATLPDSAIAVCYRSDSSGSTNIFTDYLGKISADFKKDVGVGTKVDWKVGAGENGTAGVAGFIKKTPNSLGYIELTYALQNKIEFAAVKNKAGEFVRADLESVSKAADNSLENIPDDLRFSLTDAPGKGSYPISGTTWAVVYTKQPDETAKQLVGFFTWVTHDGQKLARDLHYAPVPASLVSRIDEKLKRIGAK